MIFYRIDLSPKLGDYSLDNLILSYSDLYYVEVRLFKNVSTAKILKLFAMLKNHCLVYVDIIIDAFQVDEGVIDEICLIIPYSYQEVKKIKIFSCQENKISYEHLTEIELSVARIDGCKSCGEINESNFRINYDSHFVAKNFNSCLYNKVSIDHEGYIKNCPSMKENFGHIEQNSLSETIENKEFQVLGKINKNDILVCQDCEYRLICTDCRAYVQDPADIKSKPLKCGYNPYEGEWNDWKTDKTMQSVLEHYKLNSLNKT